MTTPTQSGTLYVVATPIGNLQDISSRAIQVLREVDLIASEDTRHTRKLLNHLSIQTPLTSYYREKEQHKARVLLGKLCQGQHIALVSDAGTPGISDPGGVLVRLARDSGITVVPVPGPSALTTALSVAGLDESSFYFGGFPPAKQTLRKKWFQQLASLPSPLIFYESPHRIKECLADALAMLGNRQAILFRELTKIHEECLPGNLEEILDSLPGRVRGELVLIIRSDTITADDRPENTADLLRWYRDTLGASLKDAVKIIAVDLGISRSRLYQEALSIWHEDKDK